MTRNATAPQPKRLVFLLPSKRLSVDEPLLAMFHLLKPLSHLCPLCGHKIGVKQLHNNPGFLRYHPTPFAMPLHAVRV
jgi:hypothetical protein